MRYTRDGIRTHLKQIGVWNWDWAGTTPEASRKPATSGFDEILNYAFSAYEKSRTAAGHMAIGREADLKSAGLYEKVCEMVDGRNIHSDGTTGNLLKTDKWARVVNDCWLLGGVHRQALFRLTSTCVMKNLWNHNGFLVVTARELIGLRNFGYEQQQIGPWQCLSCTNSEAAAEADLVKYHQIIEERRTVRDVFELVDREGSASRAQAQVARH